MICLVLGLGIRKGITYLILIGAFKTGMGGGWSLGDGILYDGGRLFFFFFSQLFVFYAQK